MKHLLLIACAALAVAASAQAGGGDVATQTVPVLNTFWSGTLHALKPFKAPTFDLYGAATHATACGPLPPHDAVYCPEDGNVYFDSTLIDRIAAEPHGFYGAVTVLAHEWGHAVQEQTGIMPWALHSEHSYYMGVELQADCYAGLFDRYAEQQGFLSADDLPGAIHQLTIWADRKNLSPRAPGAHGIASRRITWFRIGYGSGDPNKCMAVFTKLYGSSR